MVTLEEVQRFMAQVGESVDRTANSVVYEKGA